MEKSDIYSTGATPFSSDHRVKKQEETAQRQKSICLKKYVSEAFAAVILKAMDPKSEKRYKNARGNVSGFTECI